MTPRLIVVTPAYADDLTTKTGGPRGLKMQQYLANWLSAFCAATGLVVHPAKIYPTVVGPVPSMFAAAQDATTASDALTSIVIYDTAWTPIRCPILPSLPTTKYLGVYLDLKQKLDSHQPVLADLHRDLSHLLVQPASPKVKIDFIRFKILPIVLATATCSNWSLRRYRALDKPLSHAYRIILALPSKFPESVLYLPRKLLGIGLPRISDKAQLMKWEALVRSQSVGGDPRRSINGFFQRLPPRCSTSVDHLTSLTDPYTWPHQSFFVRSLVEWFTQSGLVISQRHTDPATLDENYSDNRTMRTLAESLRLRPCNLSSDEDNATLPPIRLACSDGSFTVTPRGHFDIVTSEATLRCIGRGAGGIILLPPGYNEQLHTPDAVCVSSPIPLPGMNAYAWELVTQQITLHLVRHFPARHLVLASDCQSAMARTNSALRSLNNRLANTRAGIFSTGIHCFADPFTPRQFIYTAAHPENDHTRVANPTMRDKAICIADAVAAKQPAKLGNRTFPYNRHDLLLTDLLDELIPPDWWHIRLGTGNAFPVVGDLLPYQHQRLLHTYTRQRDRTHPLEPKWTSTAYSLQTTVDVKMKFVALTGKINDTKNKQLANIAKQDKDARAVQTIRHKEQMKIATGALH